MAHGSASLAVEHLVARIADGLGVDPERVRAWALLRAVENAFWQVEVAEDPAPEIAAASRLRSVRM